MLIRHFNYNVNVSLYSLLSTTECFIVPHIHVVIRYSYILLSSLFTTQTSGSFVFTIEDGCWTETCIANLSVFLRQIYFLSATVSEIVTRLYSPLLVQAPIRLMTLA